MLLFLIRTLTAKLFLIKSPLISSRSPELSHRISSQREDCSWRISPCHKLRLTNLDSKTFVNSSHSHSPRMKPVSLTEQDVACGEAPKASFQAEGDKKTAQQFSCYHLNSNGQSSHWDREIHVNLSVPYHLQVIQW